MQICFMSRPARTRTSHGKLREKLLGEEKRKEKENRVFYLFFCYFFSLVFTLCFGRKKIETLTGKTELNLGKMS